MSLCSDVCSRFDELEVGAFEITYLVAVSSMFTGVRFRCACYVFVIVELEEKYCHPRCQGMSVA